MYSRGGSLPETEIYFSDNGGFSFQDMNSDILVSGWGKGVKKPKVEVALGGPTLLVPWVINAEDKEGHLLQYCGHSQWLL